MSKLYTPKNKLKNKVGNGGFNPVHLEDAQASIDNNDVDFVPIAAGLIKTLDEAIEEHADDQESVELRIKMLDELTQLRAQGSMFKYPSITAITDVIVDFLDSVDGMNKTIVQIVTKYSQSTKIILGKKIQNDADKVCVAVIGELREVCEKYKSKFK